MAKPSTALKPKAVVVAHAAGGATFEVGKEVLRGMAERGVETALCDASSLTENEWEQLHAADMIIFGTPTYMGSVSAPFKAFMDVTASFWLHQKWKDKLAAGYTNSSGLSGDKQSTLYQLFTFASQHSMVWVSQGLMPNQFVPQEENINRLGSYAGLMTQSQKGAIVADDLKTAYAFGGRLAEALVRWHAGKKEGKKA